MLVVVAKVEGWFLPMEVLCLVLMLVFVANGEGWFLPMDATSVEYFLGDR